MLRVVTLKRPPLSLPSVVTSAGQISAVMSDFYLYRKDFRKLQALHE